VRDALSRMTASRLRASYSNRYHTRSRAFRCPHHSRSRFYQEQCLTALGSYLAEVATTGDADTAFYKFTRRAYYEAPALPGLPYICVRVPTGGGKTILAAHSVAVAANTFLKSDTPCVLWLVPSQIIRDQTLATLRNRTHPNRRALADRFGENLRVMTVGDALYAKRADYDGGVCVIVSTLQAFRREETEGLKVYEANGELMDHFTALPDGLRHLLDKGPGGVPVPSLANVLRIRRPVVIVDEAHNARTSLSFDVLARLSPSLIVEFTATPVTPERADLAKGIIPSNILHQVSAAELKTAQMIKLPVILRGRSDANDTIADAIGWLDELASTAADEEAETGEFVRPIMLLQAERKSKTERTLHVGEVKRIENFRQPESHIAMATGEADDITGLDLFARDCPIRFIITQSKLREGWDCSFAYVLCSVAEQKSATAVEQILGRVLRLPNAQWKKRQDLNRAYAFATTTSFQTAATTLKDGLVANGFERVEAEALVHADEGSIRGLEEGGSAFVHEDNLPGGVDFEAVRAILEPATRGRVEVDAATGSIRARGALSEIDRTSLLQAVELAGGREAARTWVDSYVHRTRGARLSVREAEDDRRSFAVPRLAIRRNGTLELFDRTHFLDIPWALETCDPMPVLNYFAPPSAAADEAHLDVTAQGKAVVSFVNELHAQLSLSMEEQNWTRTALINWLDRALPRNARLDVTRTSSTLFIGKALDAIMERGGRSLEALARAKFRLAEALAKAIADHREAREQTAFDQAVMFPQSGLEFETSADDAITFDENTYAYNQPYRGAVAFRKHFARIVGDLKVDGEEHECAVHIDNLPEVKAWARNTPQKVNSFWIQSAPNKFYPDFICQLTDGRILVVEYKGADRAQNAEEQNKKAVGYLWADRSGGKCLFAWVENRNFTEIDRSVLIPEEAAPQFLDDAAPRNGMMPPPDSEMIAPPITE
jgi:type III restriction enzyme